MPPHINTQKSAYIGGFYHRAKRLITINTNLLRLAINKSCLMSLQITIFPVLVFKQPHAANDIHPIRSWNKIPGVLFSKSIIFLMHGSIPIMVKHG